MIKFENVSKDFSGNQALDQVSFNIRSGEVHALLGENGAGKSTLLNILHGIINDYSGQVFINNEKVNFNNPIDALDYGVAKVHQEVTCIDVMTLGQNISLGFEPTKNGLIDQQKLYKTTQDVILELSPTLNSKDIMKGMSVGEIQMMMIAKAIYHDSFIISFDEPTSALTDSEVNNLMSVIRKLKARGMTILYVTHRLDEVFELADRATILRDGKYIETLNVKETSKETIINKMVGRDVSSYAVRTVGDVSTSERVLDIDNLSSDGVFENISFHLNKGEILSFSGLVGAKRTDVMMTIFGAKKKTTGTIKINNKIVEIRTPVDAVKNRLALIPEDRKTQGVVSNFTNIQNITLASIDNYKDRLFLSDERQKEQADIMMESLDINPRDSYYNTSSLSGGNAQKVIIGKWLSTDADIIIFDEPTKGIDVGAKAEIYKIMEELISEGKSIIMVSSELPEVIGMSDRVIVMREGRLVKELKRHELSEERLLYYAMEG